MKRRGNAGPDTKTKGSKAGGGASPSAHREAIARIEANAARAGVTLPKGATEAAISAAEAKMGVTFPAGMRAFYLVHDGGPSDEVCDGRQLLSVGSIVHQWKIWKDLLDAGELEDDEVDPDTGVAPSWFHAKWIPVTHDFGGNHDVVDLAPAKGGTLGQIVSVYHDDGARTVEGEDFLSWLEDKTWGEGDEDEDREPAYDTSSAPSPLREGPYVFLFQLGKGAKAGETRVPRAFTTAPSYLYRQDAKSHAKKLDAIDEPDVPEDEADVVFEAIDAFVDLHELRRELYEDAEIESGREYAETRGFHAGASYADAKAALAKGGFVVVDLQAPPGVGADIDALARHTRLGSLPLLTKALRAGDWLVHGSGARDVLAEALAKGRAEALFPALARAATGFTSKMRKLLVVALYEAWVRARTVEDTHDRDVTRTLCAALAPELDAQAKTRLADLGLLPREAAPAKGKVTDVALAFDAVLARVSAEADEARERAAAKKKPAVKVATKKVTRGDGGKPGKKRGARAKGKGATKAR